MIVGHVSLDHRISVIGVSVPLACPGIQAGSAFPRPGVAVVFGIEGPGFRIRRVDANFVKVT